MGMVFAASLWAVFQGASKAAIPPMLTRPPTSTDPLRLFGGLALCEQRRKTAQRLAALGVALKRGRGLRWLLSYLLAHPPTSAGPFLLLGPLRGCAFEAALPAAPFECNKGHPHLISGSSDEGDEEGGGAEPLHHLVLLEVNEADGGIEKEGDLGGELRDV